MRSPVFAFAFLLLLATDKTKHSSLSSKFLLLIFSLTDLEAGSTFCTTFTY